MNIIAVFPIFIAGVYIYRGYKHGYIINETKHDGKLKTIRIPVKWRKLFYLKGENVLLWSVIEQVIALIVAFSAIVGGYILYAVASARVYALFSMSTIVVGSAALAINDLIWMHRSRKGQESNSSSRNRCFSCEFEAAFHNNLPIRKVYVLSKIQGKSQHTIYKVRRGKLSKKEYDAIASKNYTPIIGTYAKAAYTKNSVVHSFVLVSNWE